MKPATDDRATRLATELSAALGGTVSDLARLSGGASRETWRFTLAVPAGATRHLIAQCQRPGDARDMLVEAAVVRHAGEGGAPVPELLYAGDRADGSTMMVLAAVDGETIARRIQRDDLYATARDRLVPQLAGALAKIHALDPDGVNGLQAIDQIAWYTDILDQLGEPHPMLELVRRWLIEHRPPTAQTRLVHGDFRLGNVIVGPDGLRAVIDWELAHLGDPMEDLGWLCVKAWRFGAAPPVAGLGAYGELFDAYESAGGGPVDPDVVRWWEVLGTWKWGIMCILQASVHLTGMTRSHELAAIGRRVCENEHDLFLALAGHW